MLGGDSQELFFVNGLESASHCVREIGSLTRCGFELDEVWAGRLATRCNIHKLLRVVSCGYTNRRPISFPMVDDDEVLAEPGPEPRQ